MNPFGVRLLRARQMAGGLRLYVGGWRLELVRWRHTAVRLLLAAPCAEAGRLGSERHDPHARREPFVEIALAAVARVTQPPEALSDASVLGGIARVDARVQQRRHILHAHLRRVRLVQCLDGVLSRRQRAGGQQSIQRRESAH